MLKLLLEVKVSDKTTESDKTVEVDQTVIAALPKGRLNFYESSEV